MDNCEIELNDDSEIITNSQYIYHYYSLFNKTGNGYFLPQKPGVPSPLHIREQLGKRIRMLRRERELTQAALAEKCNLSNNFIALLERGKNAPSIDTLEALARVFKISISELFEFNVDTNKISERERAMRRLAKIRSARDWDLISAIADFLEKNQ